MNLRLTHLLSKRTIGNLSRLLNRRAISSSAIFVPCNNNNKHNYATTLNPTFHSTSNPTKSFHSSPELKFTNPQSEDEDSEDEATMNQFLSRFVYLMRGRLNEAYPDCDKQTIDAMLLVIVEKLVGEMEKGRSLEEMAASRDEFSEDLWNTVFEVSTTVYQDMQKEAKKEKMKKFLQSEKVKTMTRFASEVGVRGDMLRELRFKWAREEMEDSEFYERLERLCEEEAEEEEEVEAEIRAENATVEGAEELGGGGGGGGSGGLPKRHGKMRFKLYGLDLSGSDWKEVSDRIHEAEEVIFPEEAKPITGKCKLVTEKILALGKDDEISPYLAEWVELLQPNRVDWINLLQKLKERDNSLYLKVAEHILGEPSFQTDIRDYSRLIDAHAEENRLEDAERILKKMSENGMPPDIITLTALVHMYNKAGNLEKAREAFEKLRSQGFKPDVEMYSSMIKAYVNAGQPKLGDALMREMETRDIKPTEEIHMTLLRAFAQMGDINGAQRIVITMQFTGFQHTYESCTLLVEACAKSGNSSDARNNFDKMMELGFKPDDKCTSIMISAYEKKNELDKALNLLLQLEKDGFEPGVSTYSVLVDWLSKLQLVDEVEQILGKIAQLGEAPPFKIQVSLCDMYSKAGNEKKALQALGVLEAKKELLDRKDFERIIEALRKGGFVQDAERMTKTMEAQGFTPSESFGIRVMASQAFSGRSGFNRPRMR